MTTEMEVIEYVKRWGKYYPNYYPHYMISWKGGGFVSDSPRGLIIRILEVEHIIPSDTI